MKKTKLTEEKAKILLRRYFESRKVEKRDSQGNPIVNKMGETVLEARPATVTGMVLALGLCGREELEAITDKKTKALIDRALLKIEEEAEEKLFSKDCFNGAKLLLSVNFPRWSGESVAETGTASLGVCSVWAE